MYSHINKQKQKENSQATKRELQLSSDYAQQSRAAETGSAVYHEMK